MRDFKFKFWHKVENKWINPVLIEMHGITEANFMYLYGGNEGNMANIEICQFTECFDIKGKEIYEGDVVKYYQQKCALVHYSESIAKICFESDEVSNGWCVREKNDVFNWTLVPRFAKESLEIIGNVYETPELLK